MQAQEALEQLKADEKRAWTELLRAEQAQVAGMRLECAGAESSLRDAEHALTCQQVRGLAMTPWARRAGKGQYISSLAWSHSCSTNAACRHPEQRSCLLQDTE